MQSTCNLEEVEPVLDDVLQDGASKSRNSIVFSWTVNDVIQCHISKFEDSIELIDCNGNKWRITLSLPTDSHYWKLCLTLVQGAGFLKASFMAFVLDSEFKKKNVTRETQFFHVTASRCIDFSQFIKIDDLRQYGGNLLHNGTLVLYGELFVFDEFERHFSSVSRNSCLGQNMHSLLEHGSFADFTIRVQDREFPCHKVVLSSRSEFFQALFRNDMKEKNENTLLLEDVESDVFHQVLKFIYTGEVVISKSDVVPLLAASEKYLLSRLKWVCEEKLISYFSFCNMKSILRIADIYRLKKLKMEASHAVSALMKLSPCRELKSDKSQPPEGTAESFSKKNDGTLQRVQQNAFIPCANVHIGFHTSVIFDFVWRISKFSNRTGPISNNLFEFEDKNFEISCKMEIRLVCYEQYSLIFTLLRCANNGAELTFRFSSIDSSGVKKIISNYSGYFTKNSRQITRILNLSSEFLRQNNLVTPDGAFLMHCQCFMRSRTERHEDYPVSKARLRSDSLLIDLNTDFSDLTIRVKEAEFLCHKAIVSCRSPALARMIDESCSQGVVEISGIEPEDFQQLLSYMYTDEYGLNEAEAWKVLPIADKFEMQHLKNMCEKVLVTNLSLENAVKALDYSITHSAALLREYSFKFVTKYYLQISKRPKFDDQIIEHNLAENMFLCFSEVYFS